jgi:cytochrome c-type biogenesis protein CcmH/NrfG
MASKSSSPASAFTKVLRSFETGGFTSRDVVIELKRLLKAGASPNGLWEILRRREFVEPLPVDAHKGPWAMKRRIRRRGPKMSAYTLKLLLVATLSMSAAAWSVESPSPARATAAAAKRDSARCVSQADVDACNDAIRRNPSNPQLLVALADALVRVKRPADAVRNYRRAAALAPHMPGLAAKLSDAESQLVSARTPVPARRTRYSNAAPETQSH